MQKNISISQASDLLMTSPEEIQKLMKSKNMELLNTRDLLDISISLNNEMGKVAKDLKIIFSDKEKTKMWRRAQKHRKRMGVIGATIDCF